MGSTLSPYKGAPTQPTPPLPTPFQPDTAAQAYVFANSAYHMSTLPALVQFLHRACFSPVVDTWCKAIDAGYFTIWPGLTSKLVRKYLPAYIDGETMVATHTALLPFPQLTLTALKCDVFPGVT